MLITKASIAKWYDDTSAFYGHIWYRNSDSFALHYGLWDKKTKSLHEALLNTNRFMAKQAKMTSDLKVLDAGCGIGGSVVWLAKYLKAKVTGISISPKQIEKAKALSTKYHLDDLIHFELMDYLDTNFADETFDVVWAIESVCHAKNKKDFLKEACRVLKKGGRVIVADGFLKKTPVTAKEKQIVFDFYKGMLVPNLSSFHQFKQYMEAIGFKNIKVFDKTKEALPSSKRLHIIARLMYPFLYIATKIHLLPRILLDNCIAGIVQYEGVKINLAGYGIFYGEK